MLLLKAFQKDISYYVTLFQISGTGKRQMLEEMVGETGIDVMWSIKDALDPKGILNPGKVLAPRL